MLQSHIFPENDFPGTTPRTPNIPDIPRDHMTMAVHHRLPGRHTDIKPDVVPG
jgi:hypothetical protein